MLHPRRHGIRGQDAAQPHQVVTSFPLAITVRSTDVLVDWWGFSRWRLSAWLFLFSTWLTSAWLFPGFFSDSFSCGSFRWSPSSRKFFVDLPFVDLPFVDLSFVDLSFVDWSFIDWSFIDWSFVD
jgi:hypothetical protein